MLADISSSRSLGQLVSGVLAESHSRAVILDFIAGELPRWRDRPDRPPSASEMKLTSQLCVHLNSATRKTPGWDCLQFLTELTDEVNASRKTDMGVLPAGESLTVQGRNFGAFETILPIECKRLPTPAGKKRDEREYVITRSGTTGGIQRFKEGWHGAAHEQAAMIAYVQEQNFEHWFEQIGHWIQDLSHEKRPGWTAADALVTQWQDNATGIAVHESVHSRKERPAIRLRHLWVRMAH
jgi:hypothetical protein